MGIIIFIQQVHATAGYAGKVHTNTIAAATHSAINNSWTHPLILPSIVIVMDAIKLLLGRSTRGYRCFPP